VPAAAAAGQTTISVPAGMTGQIPVYAIAGNALSNAVTLWVQ
jgi:hypothetical protein